MKKERKMYIYEGPVYLFGVIFAKRIRLDTFATTKVKAISNLNWQLRQIYERTDLRVSSKLVYQDTWE